MKKNENAKSIRSLNKTVLLEGAIILVSGLISLIEGIRLTYMERLQLYDVLGPGRYNAAVGVLFMVAGAMYIVFHRYRDDTLIQKTSDRELRRKMISIVAVLAAYIYLLGVIGYFAATLFFFIFTFRIVGFRSWLVIVGMSILLSIFFYLLFVKFANTAFPRGSLIEAIFR